jgi:hypothetical protein
MSRPRPAPQRGAHSQFLAAGRGARQQQAGDIRAGDQQQQAHCAQKRQEGGSHVSGYCIGQRDNHSVIQINIFSVLAFDAARNHAQIGSRLGDSNPVADTANSPPVMRGTAGNFGITLTRNPSGSSGRKIEFSRHYARHGIDCSFYPYAKFR